MLLTLVSQGQTLCYSAFSFYIWVSAVELNESHNSGCFNEEEMHSLNLGSDQASKKYAWNHIACCFLGSRRGLLLYMYEYACIRGTVRAGNL